MNKKYIVTKEEMEAIKSAVSKVLDFWNYEFISAEDSAGASKSMSIETFLKALEDEFIVK